MNASQEKLKACGVIWIIIAFFRWQPRFGNKKKKPEIKWNIYELIVAFG